MSKSLVIYYSRKGENYWNGSIKKLSKGNTERVAEFIQKHTDADLFEVETARVYDEDYYKCIDEAKQELRDKARPEVKAMPEDISGYDNIFVGYPNWWGTMPMCMFTVLEKLDLNGKNIIPFCTNEGSGMGGSERDIKNICKGANVKAGLSIHGAESEKAESKVEAWLKKVL